MEKWVKIVHNMPLQITIFVWFGEYMFMTCGQMNQVTSFLK